MTGSARGGFLLVAMLLVGCGGDSPEALIADVSQAFETGDVELLAKRVDADAVIADYGTSLQAGFRRVLGNGPTAEMALARSRESIVRAQEEMRAALEAEDLAVFTKDIETTAVVQEAGGEVLIVLTVTEASTDEASELQFPLARRDGRWIVTGLTIPDKSIQALMR